MIVKAKPKAASRDYNAEKCECAFLKHFNTAQMLLSRQKVQLQTNSGHWKGKSTRPGCPTSTMLVISEAPYSPYYEKFTLPMFSTNNICLYPVNDLPRNFWKSVLGDVTTKTLTLPEASHLGLQTTVFESVCIHFFSHVIRSRIFRCPSLKTRQNSE